MTDDKMRAGFEAAALSYFQDDLCRVAPAEARVAWHFWQVARANAPTDPNLSDPAVQKRLAAQWGYVPAAETELPPVPEHPEPHTYRWSRLEARAIEQYGRACADAWGVKLAGGETSNG